MAGVLEPQLDVRRGVEHLALDHERVDVLGEPRREPLVPRLVAGDDPVGQHLAPAAGGQVAGSGAHDVLDDAVAGQAGVAVDQPFAGGRGDHERRVGRDQVEELAVHRLEERPVADLDALLDVVEGGVEAGEPQRAGVDVGRDDRLGVAGEVQGLDAAAGAEVQRPADRLAQRQLRQARGGGTDAQHVVGTDPLRRTVQPGGEVGDDPQVLVVGGVGPHVEAGGDLADALLEQALRAQVVDQAGQCRLGRREPDRHLQQEQPHQRRQR